MKRCVRLVLPLAVVCLLVATLAVILALRTVGARAASTQTCGTWSIVSSPNANPKVNELLGVAAISGSDVWAVGDAAGGSAGFRQTLTERWNGSRWNIVTSPGPGNSSFLYGVSGSSATNVWAVGNYSDSTGTIQALIEQWNGSSWVISPNPAPPSSYLFGVAAISASNVWAVGLSQSSAGPLIEHWNGTQWSIVAVPNTGGQLNAVAAVKGTNTVWAVGTGGAAGTPLIEKWNGQKWSIVPAAEPAGSTFTSLAGITVVSSSDIWAVGAYATSGPEHTLVEQWNGSAWSVVSSPNIGSNGNSLFGVSALSASDVWAVGQYYATLSPAGIRTLVEQWNGTGWNVVSSPEQGMNSNVLKAVSTVKSTGGVWAVGNYALNSAGSQTHTLTEFYC